MDLIEPGRAAHSARRVWRFALKVQQFTGRYYEVAGGYDLLSLSPSLALNEVGGDPPRRRYPSMRFPRHDADAAEEWPHGMTGRLQRARHQAARGRGPDYWRW